MRLADDYTRATHADALHQAGRRAEAEARFREAEEMQAECQPDYPLLYSLQGFLYCDLLLADPERGAWQVICSGSRRPPEDGDRSSSDPTGCLPARGADAQVGDAQ